jgi:2-polyprenyl-3-methyl-5-hydroxy-6-metoxy-1,4-benzoquinol methylase
MTERVVTGEDFDVRAATWDADPQKVERAHKTAAAIRTVVPDLATSRVLEYGCGTGLLGFALRPSVAEVTLADRSEGMLEEAKRKITASGMTNLTAVRLDLLSDPVPKERFDLICSLLTLHHVPDTAALLRAFHAMLPPGGRVCLADLDAEDGSFHGLDVDVHHGFDRAALGAQLEAAGFRRVLFQTVFEIEKARAVGVRRYSVFMVTAVRG